MLLWASRVQLTDENDPDAQKDALEVAKIAQLGLPEPPIDRGVRRLREGLREWADPRPRGRPGLLRMNIGDMDPKHPEALLSALPAGLSFEEKERTGLGPKGTLTPGLNYAMLSPRPWPRKQLDAVLEGIRGSARIVSYGPTRHCSSMWRPGRSAACARTRTSPSSRRSRRPTRSRSTPDCAPDQASRAIDPKFLLEVAVVPGSNAAAAREANRSRPGRRQRLGLRPRGLSPPGADDRGSLGKLARIPEVLSIQESLEMMQTNGKNGPAYQTGGCRKRTRPGRSTTWALTAAVSTRTVTSEGQRDLPGHRLRHRPAAARRRAGQRHQRGHPELLPDRHGGFRHHHTFPSATHRKSTRSSRQRGQTDARPLPGCRRPEGRPVVAAGPRLALMIEWTLRCVALGMCG